MPRMRTLDWPLRFLFLTIAQGHEVPCDVATAVGEAKRSDQERFSNQEDGAGHSLLFQAVAFNNLPWIAFLLKHGAHLDHTNNAGNNILDITRNKGDGQGYAGDITNLLPYVNWTHWNWLCSTWSQEGWRSVSQFSSQQQWHRFLDFLTQHLGHHVLFIQRCAGPLVSSAFKQRLTCLIDDLETRLFWPVDLILHQEKMDVVTLMCQTEMIKPAPLFSRLIREGTHPHPFWNSLWFMMNLRRPATAAELNSWADYEDSLLWRCTHVFPYPSLMRVLFTAGADPHRATHKNNQSLLRVMGELGQKDPAVLACAHELEALSTQDLLLQHLDTHPQAPEEGDKKNRKM